MKKRSFAIYFILVELLLSIDQRHFSEKNKLLETIAIYLFQFICIRMKYVYIFLFVISIKKCHGEYHFEIIFNEFQMKNRSGNKACECVSIETHPTS